MVLLTITPTVQSAIQLYNQLHVSEEQPDAPLVEPSLADPKVGAPVSHAQLIDAARFLRQHATQDEETFRLDSLLKGATIYIPPPKPKPQPVCIPAPTVASNETQLTRQNQSAEYASLMARLRQEEEHREYERMINPPPPETSFATSHMPAKEEDDEVTYADVNRQLALIINVLVSIIACSVAIWIAARHWSVPQRLALSMSGSAIVAVAEVVIYSGYLRRVKEAKLNETAKTETKEVVDTWVIEKKDSKVEMDSVRYRKGKHR